MDGSLGKDSPQMRSEFGLGEKRMSKLLKVAKIMVEIEDLVKRENLMFVRSDGFRGEAFFRIYDADALPTTRWAYAVRVPGSLAYGCQFDDDDDLVNVIDAAKQAILNLRACCDPERIISDASATP